VAGGVFSAGADRLFAPGRRGVPHVIAPGCVDMVNFHSMASVPVNLKAQKRHFYEWNANVVLMRTNREELQQIVGVHLCVVSLRASFSFVRPVYTH
jgi:uncharacterized protein (UPF0261 family)